MQIDIQAREFTLTEALDAYVKRRLHCALGSRYDQISRINVRLSDINGPRGGKDKRCQVLISSPKFKDILVVDTEADLYVAISRATERAARTVDRRLSRKIRRSRKDTGKNSIASLIALNNATISS